jgi:hypothetical protein
MIIERFTYQVKPYRLQEAIALVQEERNHSPRKEHIRIYHTMFGTMDQLVLEFEFDDLAQHAEHWDQWFGSERAAPFGEKWRDLIESGAQREIFRVV